MIEVGEIKRTKVSRVSIFCWWIVIFTRFLETFFSKILKKLKFKKIFWFCFLKNLKSKKVAHRLQFFVKSVFFKNFFHWEMKVFSTLFFAPHLTKNFVRTLIHFQHTFALRHTKKMRKNFFQTFLKKFKFCFVKFIIRNHTFFRNYFDSKSHL